MDQVTVSAIALAALVVAVLILVWMTSAKQVAPGWRVKSSRVEKFTPPGSPYIAAGPLRNFPPPGYFGTDTCGPCDNYNPQPEWKFMAPKTSSTKGDSCC